jgi:hypothetical protein
MSPRRTFVFHYKATAGRPSPMVSVGLFVAGQWRVVELYVDSGAFYTLMHATHALDYGLDFKKGRKVFVQVGDGSLIPVFLNRLPMQIGGKRFEATVGFSEKLGVRFNLLGRLDVFQHFKICFDEKRKLVTFQTVDGS